MSTALQIELATLATTIERFQREQARCQSVMQHRLLQAEIDKVQHRRQEILSQLQRDK